MAVHDARDFFFSFPLHPSSRKYLAFEIPCRNGLWRWKGMSFGIASAPYYACKFSEEIARKLRAQGHKILVYCNDFISVGDTKAECEATAAALEKILSDLGVSIAPGKVDPPA